MKTKYIIFLFLLSFNLITTESIRAQTAMINVVGRNSVSLNGSWNAIVDPTNNGEWRKYWEEKKPEKKTDFFEYSFQGGLQLNVPGDFNSQKKELTYYENTVWYQRNFNKVPIKEERCFLHFGAVNYLATVYLNGQLIGTHEGGFTPFQFEVTAFLKAEGNSLIVKVDNHRRKDGIPAEGYDWFNYGGITRDVNLISTTTTYIDDYSIQLKKDSAEEVLGFVQLNGNKLSQKVQIRIPELNLNYKLTTDKNGFAAINFKVKLQRWQPENPKLYGITILSETDTVSDKIGFRNIAVKGKKILLNGKPIFLKGINIHEENPLQARRSYTKDDAELLLYWAKELGCNWVRLVHYPHNEQIIQLAESMGLMVWEELPIYQHIEFSNQKTQQTMETMLKEMVKRDKNRCSIVVWNISNETFHFTPNRDEVTLYLIEKLKKLDTTRLTSIVLSTQGYENNTMNLWDPIYNYVDIMSVNEYLGWYAPWHGPPKDAKWTFINDNKPIIVSEFGGEALFGNKNVPTDEANYWSEEYQEQIFKDQLLFLKNNKNLAGMSPWLLVDYRSLSRQHPVYQKGWNRKGLLSDRGDKKKAWYIIESFYKEIVNQY